MIAREPFNGKESQHVTVPNGEAEKPRLVTGSLFYVECRMCGFEPEEQVTLPAHRCPKCHCHAWRRLVRPGGWLGRLPDWPGLKLRGKVRQRSLTGESLDPVITH
jgi:hypothetical protein